MLKEDKKHFPLVFFSFGDIIVWVLKNGQEY
jgi:hypothetical protein